MKLIPGDNLVGSQHRLNIFTLLQNNLFISVIIHQVIVQKMYKKALNSWALKASVLCFVCTFLVAGSKTIALFQQVDVMIGTQLRLVWVYGSMESVTCNVPPFFSSCRMLPFGDIVNLCHFGSKGVGYQLWNTDLEEIVSTRKLIFNFIIMVVCYMNQREIPGFLLLTKIISSCENNMFYSLLQNFSDKFQVSKVNPF